MAHIIVEKIVIVFWHGKVIYNTCEKANYTEDM